MALSQNNCLADIKADLYATPLPDGFTCLLLGETARDDTPVRIYVYSTSSTATDDGENILKPTSVSGAGRWLKQYYQQLQANWTESTTTALDYIQNKPDLAPVATSGNYNDLSNRPSFTTRSASVSTPSLNTSFQVSTSNDALVFYPISISVVSTLLGTNIGNVELQTSADNSTWTTIAKISLSFAGVASTLVAIQMLNGYVPAGYHVKLLTSESGSNGATFIAEQGQIVLL
jgi:hypothetical protein